QGEDGDIGAHVEADVVQVAEGAVDVEAAAVEEVDLTGGVAAVLHGQDGGGEQGRLALAAVGVAAQDPAAVAGPARLVGGVGVVAEGEVGAVGGEAGQHLLGGEAF